MLNLVVTRVFAPCRRGDVVAAMMAYWRRAGVRPWRSLRSPAAGRGPGAFRKPPMGTVAPRDAARRAQNAIGRLPEPSEASRF